MDHTEDCNIMINTAHIGVSYKCNMNCQHCFVTRNQDDDVFYDHYAEIIDWLYQHGLSVLFYTYGEPLVTNKFYEVAQYVSGKRICQVLMTNGYEITDNAIIKKIKDVGMKQVYVSIDSIDAHKHDDNRRKKGAWTHAIKALELLAQSDIISGIACTITDRNCNEMCELYKLAQDLKINYISMLRCRIGGKLIKLHDYDCYSNSIKKLVSENQNSKVGIRVHDLSLIPMFKKMLNENQISNNEYKKFEAMCSCHQQYNINIAPNGDVYQCDFALTPVGNITLNTLNNIIDRCYISHCSCN